MSYSIETDHKWQEKWAETGLYKFNPDADGKKLYCLEMFSYPSGANLHLGHWYNYSLTDSWARFKHMQGYNLFHPMGFDSFGLPAENYAIKTGKVLAVGESASLMLGRTPGIVEAIRPLREGVISDFRATEVMLKAFIGRVCTGLRATYFKPTIVVCVPSVITPVEQQAVENACRHAGAKDVFLIREPIAAAIGAGIDITKACGSMVVDIGGGTTDISVISLCEPVVDASLKVAGDKFDEAIIKHVRKRHNILIGEKTAEKLKIEIGCAYPRDEELTLDVQGRNIITGLPSTVTVSSTEMLEALEEPITQIFEAVHNVLERTPPELMADISQRGIVMTGGGAMLYGLDHMLSNRIGIDVYLAQDPVSCVVIGTGKALDMMDKFAALSDN